MVHVTPWLIHVNVWQNRLQYCKVIGLQLIKINEKKKRKKKETACRCRRCRFDTGSLSREDPLEEETATHASILAWEVPWSKKPGGLQSTGLQKTLDIVAAGFPGCSASNESACIAGDPGSIPGSGRSAGEGIGYPCQCFWASLIAQRVKNPLAMGEIWIQSLGWEDPLEKGTCYPLQYSGLQNSMDGGASQATGGRKESDMTEWLSLHFTLISNVFFIIKFYKGSVCEIFKEVTFDLCLKISNW